MGYVFFVSGLTLNSQVCEDVGLVEFVGAGLGTVACITALVAGQHTAVEGQQPLLSNSDIICIAEWSH